MAENAAVAGLNSSDPLNGVANALEAALKAAKDGSTDARAAAENAIPAATRFVARLVYTTSYTVAYGVVFPSMLIAKSVPTDSLISRGFADGAHAAVEKVDHLKRRQASSDYAPGGSKVFPVT
jgi:hypothetical protein